MPETERDSQRGNLNISDDGIQKTLGLRWSVKNDCFRFSVNMPSRPSTKRGLLSCIASLYDPLGFVAPILLRPKRLLQQLCRKKLGWDEPLDEVTVKAWEEWKHSVYVVASLDIPRCVKPRDFDIKKKSLHIFSDASEIGYGAVAYLRYVSNAGRVQCAFLFGKSRVSPLKALTIPLWNCKMQSFP